jgi:broad-specificity NMP kinase
MVMSCVLGAPGAGKSTVVEPLRRLLRDWVVLDWDALMGPAGLLTGTGISQTPSTWDAYTLLVRTVVEQILPVRVALLGVCTPDELRGWPITEWLLLDCSDEERRRRLAPRKDPAETEEALEDAGLYRSFGLAVVDSTGRTPTQVAKALADRIDPPTV